MLNIRDDHFGAAWARLLSLLMASPHEAGPRGQRTKEELGVHLEVESAHWNILVHPQRKLSYRGLVAEWFWILGGFNSLGLLTPYLPRYAEYSDDGLTLAGAYGPRLRPQWTYVLDKLHTDRDTRQAVASIWTPDPAASRDIPCTLSVQFLIRGDLLHTIVTMRSSDIWLGLPYDFFTFGQLASWVASVNNAGLGSLVFNLGSSHLYERNFEAADEVLLGTAETVRSPRLPQRMPSATELHDALKLRDGGFHDEVYNGYRRVLAAPSQADALEVLRELATR